MERLFYLMHLKAEIMAGIVCRFAVSFSCILLGLYTANAEQPNCSSRFDYEYKVVEKLVSLKQKQDGLLKTIEAQEAKVTLLQNQLKELSDKISVPSSVFGAGVYTRWGRTSCPGNGTDTVYHGYAAGSWYRHHGAASNFLCLPAQPTWGHFQGSASESSSLVYGAEYQLDGRNLINFFGSDLHDQDAPCAVYNTVRASVLMIPGRTSCFSDWTLEYKGYLVSGNYNHEAASEYICLDEQAEVVEGGHASMDGKLMYFAVSRCGPLKCPPYVDHRELACVVCSR